MKFVWPCLIAALSWLGGDSKVYAFDERPGFAVEMSQADYDWGVLALDDGDYDVAVAYFSDAIRRNPVFADAYIRLAYVYGLKRDFKAADAVYRRLALVNPQRATVLKAVLDNLRTFVRYRIPIRPARLTVEEWGEF